MSQSIQTKTKLHIEPDPNQNPHPDNNDCSNAASKDGHAVAMEDETQCLVGGTNEKFVAEQMRKNIDDDLVRGLNRFKDTPRSKVDFKLPQEEKDEENQRNRKLSATHMKKKKNNNSITTLGQKSILNLPRSTFCLLEQKMTLKDFEEELLQQARDKIDAKGQNNKSHAIKSP